MGGIICPDKEKKKQLKGAAPTGPKDVKLVLVGDTTVGKSCLIVNYQQQVFSEDYEPSVLDVFQGKRTFEGQTIGLEVHDTSGDPHLGVNRQVCYNRTDCFMLCVAVNARTSFENLIRWKTEIRQVCPDTPIILIGTKSDLRGSVENPVTLNELQAKAREMGFQACCETSSKEWQDHNVNKAFQKAIRTGYLNKYPESI